MNSKLLTWVAKPVSLVNRSLSFQAWTNRSLASNEMLRFISLVRWDMGGRRVLGARG